MSAEVQRNAGGNWAAVCVRCRPAWASADVTTQDFAQKAADQHNRQKHSDAPAKPVAAAARNEARPCHICGSTSVVRKHPRSRKVFFTWWLWAMEKKTYCGNCGAQRSA